MRALKHDSLLSPEIFASTGTTAFWVETEVFLCGPECPVCGHTAAGRHDPEQGSDQEGPLCG